MAIFIIGCTVPDIPPEEENSEQFSPSAYDLEAESGDGKKIMYIDSYNKGYPWSDGIQRGIDTILADKNIQLKIHRMDTKRNKEEDFKKQAAFEAKSAIEQFNPDIVIVSDDNAFKYLVMKYYKNSELPFVYCGVDWDSSIYGAPYSNTVGMIEISQIPQLVNHLKSYSDGDKVGYIAADTYTARKEGEYFRKIFRINLTETYADDFDDWKAKFLEIQDSVDILIIGNTAGTNEWKDNDAKEFVMENTHVVTGVVYDFMIDYGLIGLVKSPEEQGEWAAQTAWDILNRVNISEFPESKNKKVRLYLNMKLAEKLGVEFSPELLNNGELIE